MFVLTGAGVVESRDGGASWSAPIPPPKDLKGIGPLTWVACCNSLEAKTMVWWPRLPQQPLLPFQTEQF